MPKSTWEVCKSPGHHGGEIMSSTTKALSSTAAAAAANTAVWYSSGNLGINVVLASLLPCEFVTPPGKRVLQLY